MARRVTGANRLGMYVPQLIEGLKARAAFMDLGFPGMRHSVLDGVVAIQTVAITATDVWFALYAVDQRAADEFKAENSGPWPWANEPIFEFDPLSNMLQSQDLQA